MARSRLDAKDYAKEHILGLYGAAPVPYSRNGSIDETSFRANLRYWRDILGIKGLWVGGFQSEQWGISTAQRKRIFEITVEESHGKMHAICASMDDVIEDALDLAKFADEIGSETLGLSGPRVSVNVLGQPPEDKLYEYFDYICGQVHLPVIILNQPAMLGYSLSPQLIARLADLPNIVAIKNVVNSYHARHADDSHYQETLKLVGDKIVVSDPNESRFLEHLTSNGQRALLAGPAPLLFQSQTWKPIQQYFDLAQRGALKEAAQIDQDLQPIRETFWNLVTELGALKSRPLMKYWLELLGEQGGCSVYPSIELSDEEKRRVHEAVERTPLNKTRNPSSNELVSA